ncbi:unnamed protein product, partial [Amoebophrya sp. A120]
FRIVLILHWISYVNFQIHYFLLFAVGTYYLLVFRLLFLMASTREGLRYRCGLEHMFPLHGARPLGEPPSFSSVRKKIWGPRGGSRAAKAVENDCARFFGSSCGLWISSSSITPALPASYCRQRFHVGILRQEQHRRCDTARIAVCRSSMQRILARTYGTIAPGPQLQKHPNSKEETTSEAKPNLPKGRSWRPLRAFGAVFLLTYVAYTSYSHDFTLKGPFRGLRFWQKVGPLLLQYLYLSKWAAPGETEAELRQWDRLHEHGASVAYQVILELRGFYIKVGQFMSARPDLLPGPYIEKFRRLQNELPQGVAVAEIEEDLRRATQNSIAFLDPDCLGAASIGQAHRATLNSGAPVVLKIQYPDAKLLFRVDIECIRTVVQLVLPQMRQVFTELKKQFMFEFDYLGEMRNLEEMQRNLRTRNMHDSTVAASSRKSSGDKGGRDHARPRPTFANNYFTPEHVAVPNVYPEFCSDNVLVMQELEGVKLEEGLFGKQNAEFFTMAHINERMTGNKNSSASGPGRAANVVSERQPGRPGGSALSTDITTAPEGGTSGSTSAGPVLFREWLVSFFGRNLDLLPYVLSVAHAAEVFYYQLRSWLLLPFLAVFGPGVAGVSSGRDAVSPKNRKHEDARAQLVLRAKKLVHLLLKVHGEQIFHHGFFQADPHPGNFLLMPDGRLGLIDFGQAKRLTVEERRKLAKLVLAIADDDRSEIVRVMRDEYKFAPASGSAAESSPTLALSEHPGKAAAGRDAKITEGNSTSGERITTSPDGVFLEKLARSAFGGLDSKLTDGKPIQEFSANMRKQYNQNPENGEIPGELYLPMRTAVLLRGIGLLLQQFVSPAEVRFARCMCLRLEPLIMQQPCRCSSASEAASHTSIRRHGERRSVTHVLRPSWLGFYVCCRRKIYRVFLHSNLRFYPWYKTATDLEKPTFPASYVFFCAMSHATMPLLFYEDHNKG